MDRKLKQGRWRGIAGAGGQRIPCKLDVQREPHWKGIWANIGGSEGGLRQIFEGRGFQMEDQQTLRQRHAWPAWTAAWRPGERGQGEQCRRGTEVVAKDPRGASTGVGTLAKNANSLYIRPGWLKIWKGSFWLLHWESIVVGGRLGKVKKKKKRKTF